MLSCWNGQLGSHALVWTVWKSTHTTLYTATLLLLCHYTNMLTWLLSVKCRVLIPQYVFHELPCLHLCRDLSIFWLWIVTYYVSPLVILLFCDKRNKLNRFSVVRLQFIVLLYIGGQVGHSCCWVYWDPFQWLTITANCLFSNDLQWLEMS